MEWLQQLPMICRLCGSNRVKRVFDLGDQVVGSYFPASKDEELPILPLLLMRCTACGLVQLSDSPDHAHIYSTGHYGYRSGQNPTMVQHLFDKAQWLQQFVPLERDDLVLDIGMNDGTLLRAFDKSLRKMGMDPTADQWAEYIPDDVDYQAKFFSAEEFFNMSMKRATLITSLSMLYDLEDPVAFAKQIKECLATDGIWHFEQCYLPTMLQSNSYDTICHEHLTYFTVDTVEKVLAEADLRICDVQYNDVNGGSFAVSACHKGNFLRKKSSLARPGIEHVDLYAFTDRARQLRDELVSLVSTLNFLGERVGALGASTKGNTLLQYCGFTSDDIAMIGEINKDKISRYTPGSGIPIVSEQRAIHDCDYLLVLPWHFRDGIIQRMTNFLAKGGRLIFPLPKLEVVRQAKTEMPRGVDALWGNSGRFDHRVQSSK